MRYPSRLRKVTCAKFDLFETMFPREELSRASSNASAVGSGEAAGEDQALESAVLEPLYRFGTVGADMRFCLWEFSPSDFDDVLSRNAPRTVSGFHSAVSIMLSIVIL